MSLFAIAVLSSALALIPLISCGKKSDGPEQKSALKSPEGSSVKSTYPPNVPNPMEPEKEEEKKVDDALAPKSNKEAGKPSQRSVGEKIAVTQEDKTIKEDKDQPPKSQKKVDVNVEKKKEDIRPDVIKKTVKEEEIAKGAVRAKGDYPTFNDVASDWDSEKEKVVKKKDEASKSKNEGKKEDETKTKTDKKVDETKKEETPSKRKDKDPKREEIPSKRKENDTKKEEAPSKRKDKEEKKEPPSKRKDNSKKSYQKQEEKKKDAPNKHKEPGSTRNEKKSTNSNKSDRKKVMETQEDKK